MLGIRPSSFARVCESYENAALLRDYHAAGPGAQRQVFGPKPVASRERLLGKVVVSEHARIGLPPSIDVHSGDIFGVRGHRFAHAA